MKLRVMERIKDLEIKDLKSKDLRPFMEEKRGKKKKQK